MHFTKKLSKINPGCAVSEKNISITSLAKKHICKLRNALFDFLVQFVRCKIQNSTKIFKIFNIFLLDTIIVSVPQTYAKRFARKRLLDLCFISVVENIGLNNFGPKFLAWVAWNSYYSVSLRTGISYNGHPSTQRFLNKFLLRFLQGQGWGTVLRRSKLSLRR